MAQTLGFIASELEKVKRAAADTTEQMRLLEKAMALVVIKGAEGSGAQFLKTSGAGVQNVSRNALNNPQFNPSGSPVGGRAIVGSGVDTAKIKSIAAEYDRQKIALVTYTTQLDVLTKASAAEAAAITNATAASEGFAAAKSQAAELVKIQQDADLRFAAQRKESANASNKEYKVLGDKVRAYEAQIAAVKKATDKQNEVTATLGDLVRGGGVVDSTNLSDNALKGGDAQAPPRYTPESLKKIFGERAFANISEKAEAAGYKPENIKDITEYANSYKQLRYEIKGTDIDMRKMVLTTDTAGNVFTSTQKQFRTFFGAIRRNVTEMMKWSAATLVVWGAIRKLGELLQIAIDNETKLASIAVILGEEHANLTDVFNSAAEAAAATGESIDGVLEGYVQAYRATGNIADETERARQAQVLLTSALTLSKLSSLTTAQAMDVLTGALRQAGLGFEEGNVLIDKWVAVSRQANVGIETLAESFAITATSASNAGLSWDQLNGVIATLAESTTLSATESGNAIRAFISGFTTDTAVKELTKYGIAVTDSKGETRGFLDVMQEIAAMFEKGIINESELNDISTAIGGGARRSAQVATTIKNLGRAEEVAAISAAANGDAQKALAIQLDTVQTAITKLNNSFQKLARTMGAEGGVLGVASEVLSIFTGLVDATAAITKNLGDMTPIVAAIGVLFAATSSQTRGLMATNIVGGIGSFINKFSGGGLPSLEEQRMAAGMEGGFASTGGGARIGLGTRVQDKLLGPGYGRNAGSLLGQGLSVGFTAFSAAKDLQQGNVAGAGGSIAGGIIGGLLTGGSPVGILIGTVAGEAFANATFNYKTDFENFFTSIFDEAVDPDAPGRASDTDKATSNLFASLGFGDEGIGKFLAKISTSAMNIGYRGGSVIGNATGGLSIQRPGYEDYTWEANQPRANLTPEKFALNARAGSPEALAIYRLREDENAARGLEAGVKPSGKEFASVNEQDKLLQEYKDYLAELEVIQADIFRTSALKGDISSKDLDDALEQIPHLQSALTGYEVAFGDALRSTDDEIDNVTDSFDYWTNIVVNGSVQQVAHLNSIKNEIAEINNAAELAADRGTPDTIRVGVDDLATPDVDERKLYTRETARAKTEELAQQGVFSAALQTKELNQERIKLPTVVDLELDEADYDLFYAEMEKVQQQAFEGFWEEGLLADASASEIAETFEPFFLALGEAGAGKFIEGFDQVYAQKAFNNLVEEGTITPTESSKRRGLQTFDISSGELPGVMSRYNELKGIAAGAGYVPDEETFAALFTDYIAMPITADLTLLNIAMQELISVNKKELDGIYNLPTDSSFYVPFSGYQLGFVNQGGQSSSGLAGGTAGEEEVVKKAVDAVVKASTRPDRWQIEQDARTQNMKDREVATQSQEGLSVEERNKARGRTGKMIKEPNITIGIPGERSWEEGYGGRRRNQVTEGIQPFDKPLEPLPGGTFGSEIVNTFRELINSLFGLNGEDSTITTKLQIESTTNTIIQLDGQVIANAIKPYLLNDEVRYEGTAGSAVKRFVI